MREHILKFWKTKTGGKPGEHYRPSVYCYILMLLKQFLKFGATLRISATAKCI